MTSRLAEPLQMRWQESQTPQGSPSGVRFSQLSAIASTRARVVLPTPRGPQSRYPCATRPRAMAPLSVFETCDCTATDAKFRGRYLRARASIAIGNGEPETGTNNRNGSIRRSLAQRRSGTRTRLRISHATLAPSTNPSPGEQSLAGEAREPHIGSIAARSQLPLATAILQV